MKWLQQSRLLYQPIDAILLVNTGEDYSLAKINCTSVLMWEHHWWKKADAWHLAALSSICHIWKFAEELVAALTDVPGGASVWNIVYNDGHCIYVTVQDSVSVGGLSAPLCPLELLDRLSSAAVDSVAVVLLDSVEIGNRTESTKGSISLRVLNSSYVKPNLVFFRIRTLLWRTVSLLMSDIAVPFMCVVLDRSYI